jgi:hypothetical protein
MLGKDWHRLNHSRNILLKTSVLALLFPTVVYYSFDRLDELSEPVH